MRKFRFRRDSCPCLPVTSYEATCWEWGKLQSSPFPVEGSDHTLRCNKFKLTCKWQSSKETILASELQFGKCREKFRSNISRTKAATACISKVKKWQKSKRSLVKITGITITSWKPPERLYFPTGSPTCEVIILRNKRRKYKSLCGKIYDRSKEWKLKIQSNFWWKYLTLLSQWMACFLTA